MGDKFQTLSGGCLCGAVRFTATVAAPGVFDVCHCSMCRRWAGGPWFGVETIAVAFENPDAVRKYRSSEWAERWSCKHCGGALAYALVESGQVAVAMGALDDANGLTFHKEVFVDEQPDTYRFANNVKRQTGEECIAEYYAAQAAQETRDSADG